MELILEFKLPAREKRTKFLAFLRVTNYGIGKQLWRFESKMRVSLTDLSKSKKVVVTGEEGWLAKIYELFAAPKDQQTPKVSAELHISEYHHDICNVDVSLRYEPFVDCSLCATPIRWPLTIHEQVQYRHPPENELPREHNLAKEELDHYFFDQDAIDIEALLNELIQIALPSRLIKRSADGSSCTVCQRDLRASQAYEDPGDFKKDNPFEALKKLKKTH